MEVSNNIVLRPRFTLEVRIAPEKLLTAFERTNQEIQSFIVSRVDDHIFIRIPKREQHLWSPQLHLEMDRLEAQPTIIKGLYGPSSTVWTLFMFLHFVITSLLTAAGIWL